VYVQIHSTWTYALVKERKVGVRTESRPIRNEGLSALGMVHESRRYLGRQGVVDAGKGVGATRACAAGYMLTCTHLPTYVTDD